VFAHEGATSSYTSVTDDDGNGISGNLVGANGNVIWSDNNNTNVYMSDGQDVTHIGNFGGSIDVSVIVPNVLALNKISAKKMDEAQWIAHVLPNQAWDYKSNTSTIFGIAWAYDLKAREKNDSYVNTRFASSNRVYDDAAQFGNFNAGYTGTYAGISAMHQYTYAGLGEIAKRRSVEDMADRWRQIVLGIPPYGDEWNDYLWNTRGMTAAKRGE
jgi:hypothetical protein